jgi:tRNA pseudouridine38-40 synthase
LHEFWLCNRLANRLTVHFTLSVRNFILQFMSIEAPERRIRITLAYDGTDFHGWQVQPGLPTIQGTLEEIVSMIEGVRVDVHGSGRTDAGVHAEAQVAAFTLRNPIPVDNLRRAINRLLPPAIRVLHAEEAPPDFHPRFDAIAKTYEYRIFRGEICPPWIWRYVLHHPYPLAVDRMIEAAREYEGEHDFTAFAASDERDAEARSKVRRIFSCALTLSGDVLSFHVRGSGFLKHMVRNLMGTLLEAGKGNRTADDVRLLLQPGVREKAAYSVPAKGLHLLSVEYGEKPRSLLP